MKKSLIVAGMGAIVAAGAVAGAALAQSQTQPRPAAPAAQAAPPARGARAMPGMPGMPGMGMPGDRMGGRMGMGPRFGRDGGDRGGRGGFRGRRAPTPEQIQQRTQQIQQRNATLFAQLDANKDGRVTQAEYTSYVERQRAERQRQAFLRFSGGADSVTLDQLNARATQRLNQRQGGQPAPAQPPAARPAPAR